MTALLHELVMRDPVLVLTLLIIVVLVIYIEIMRLKILFITRTLEVALNGIRDETNNEGSGCLGTLVMIIVVALLAMAFVAVIVVTY